MSARPLVVIVVVAALLRFGALWLHSPSDSIYSDMGLYHAQALRVLSDTLSPHDTLRPIGYAAFVAAVYAMTHRSVLAVGLVQAMIGVLACGLTYPLARRFRLPHAWALLASAVVAVYPPFIFYGTYLLTEAISPVLLSGLVLAALWSFEQPTWKRAGVVGLVFALGAIVRPNTLPLLPFLCLAAWRGIGGGWRPALAWTIRVLVTAAPLLGLVVSLNSQLTGRLVGLSTNGGLNFFLMQTDYQGVRAYEWTFAPVLNNSRYRVTFESDAPLYEEDYYYREGMRAVRADPVRALWRVPDHLREGWGLGQQVYWPARSLQRATHQPSLERRILQYCSRSFFWLFVALPLLMLGRLLVDGGLWQPENSAWVLVAGAVATLCLTFVVFLADPRMHVPFDALFVVATLAAARAVLQRRRGAAEVSA